MKRQRGAWNYCWIASSLLALGSVSPAIAQQNELTRAQIYKLQNRVELLLRAKPVRPAKLSDVLVPQDALRTAVRSTAELLFNEGSLARIAEKTTFRFIPGLRRFQLKNGVAQETIFQLSDGTALIVNPPGSTGTKIETADTQINLLATAVPIPPTTPGETSAIAGSPGSPSISGSGSGSTPGTPSATPPGSAPPSSPGSPTPSASGTPTPVAAASIYQPRAIASALVVETAAATGNTQFYALTNSNFTVTTPEGKTLVALQGGQTVAIRNGQLGPVQEFDLQSFYKNNPLVAGLGPSQASLITQEPIALQPTLNAVRPETLAAIKSQQRRLSGFRSSFLRDALTGSSSFEFDGQKGKPSSARLQNPTSISGTFTRTGENTAVFVGSDGSQVPISVNFDNRSISINGNAGVANSVGLSGNNASGTVINANGQAIQIEVFGVGGNEPAIGSSFPGSLSTGIAPDR